MQAYIALFRGINVGGRHRLPMKDLVRIFEGLGYQDIRTYIQSGNVVLCSDDELNPDDSDAISEAVESEFGFRPDVMLLTESDLKRTVDQNPFPTDVGKHLHFTFLEREPDAPDLKTLEGLKSETEQFKLNGKVFYFYAPDGIGRSKAVEKIERCLGVSGTARNFNTVNAILQLL